MNERWKWNIKTLKSKYNYHPRTSLNKLVSHGNNHQLNIFLSIINKWCKIKIKMEIFIGVPNLLIVPTNN
jgi:hypothetical protein